ncbi:MAG: hypothetical protein NTY36_03465 [Deltaproteobacteria bacterium]|nr:hypothetical protein [Deltaproteobacteria bacterium]
MSSVVLELQRDALDRNVRVSDLLRKALIVARKLNLHEFQDWVENELTGYKDTNNIPEYREMRGQICGFDLYRGWLPVLFSDKRMEDLFSKRKCAQPMAELEHMIEGKKSGDQFIMPLPHNLQLKLCEIIRFKTEVNFFIDQSAIVHVIEAVRNIILNWSLKLEEDGILGEGLSFSQREKESAIKEPQNITNFYGPVSSPQIQQGEVHGIQISVNLSGQLEEIGKFIEKFKEALPSIKLAKDQTEEAEAELLTVETQIKSPKPKPSIIHEGLKSLRTILEGAGGAVAGQLLGELIKIIM